MDFNVNLGALMTNDDYNKLELYATIDVDKTKEVWEEAKK